MGFGFFISTDRQAREATRTIAQLDQALSSESTIADIVKGLPEQAVLGVRKSLSTERRELEKILRAYEAAKEGDSSLLRQLAGNDLGAILIVARISQGLSQKELARKLGLREQAIQRYEAERYRSISLTNFQKVASVLDVSWKLDLSPAMASWGSSLDVPPKDARRVIRHARANGWLAKSEATDEDALDQLKRYVADHVVKHGTPSLLRTGMNVRDDKQDWSLLSWKAQVTRRAEQIIQKQRLTYRPLEVSWLLELVKLSRHEDGPVQARELLLQHGIVLVAEPQVPGMSVDGAAFLIDHIPVIGMTLLRDTIDNFWFTLMHEVGHVVLHYRTGLASGFFDDFKAPDIDEIEAEANDFAGNMLIPAEVWKRSPARIAKTAAPIERLSAQLGIHPAIIFGRLRMERDDYTIFSSKIGRGQIRKHLLPETEGVN